LWVWNGLPLNAYVSTYARTNRCYKERGSTTNYVRSSILHCTIEHHSEEEKVSCINLYNNLGKDTDRKIKDSAVLALFPQVFAVSENIAGYPGTLPQKGVFIVLS